MRRPWFVPAFVVFHLIARSTPAAAQSSAPIFVREPEPHEIGVEIGALNDREIIGGHFTRTVNDWLAAEASLSASARGGGSGAPTHVGLMTIEARFRVHNPNHGWLFMTAGEGLGTGLRFPHAAIVGAGLQSEWLRFTGWRLEYQEFIRAGDVVGGRVTLGLLIALPR